MIAELGRVFLAFAREIFFQMGNALLVRNVFVMVPDLGLGGRGVDRLWKLVGFLKPFRQRNAAYRAVLLVAGPAASGDVSPDNTFDGEHVELPAHHTVSVKLRLTEKFGHVGHIGGDHVVGQNILSHIKPETGHLCQYGSFFGHVIFQDHVKAADSVCGNHDQAVAVVVDLTDLSFFYRFHLVHLTLFISAKQCMDT